MTGRRVVAVVAAAVGLALGAPNAAHAQTATDASIRAAVEAALQRASDVPADSISVQVRAGIVTLTGSLLCDDCGGNATPGGTATVQQSLGAIVRAVPGVERVEFRLRYAPS